MFILTKKNIINYLDKNKSKIGIDYSRIVSIESMDSNSRFVFKAQLIILKKKINIIIKQAREYSKQSILLRHPQKMRQDRIFYEIVILKYLRNIWPAQILPKIYYIDNKNYIVVLSDIATKKKLLKEEFERNKIYPKIGKPLGFFLGKLHSTTIILKNKEYGYITWQKEIQKFFKSRLYGLKRLVSTESIKNFYKSSLKTKHCLIWGDPIYRNIFVSSQKKDISLTDFEYSTYYDPSFDVGVLLGHWFWMFLKNKKLKWQVFIFIKLFMSKYNQEFIKRKKKKYLKKIWQRSMKWVGAYLVSRTNGLHGSYFKKYPKWEKKIRATGVNIFLENFKIYPDNFNFKKFKKIFDNVK